MEMHVDVTGDDNARREANEDGRDVNTVLGAVKSVVYTVEPLFAALNCCDAEKNFLDFFIFLSSLDSHKTDKKNRL